MHATCLAWNFVLPNTAVHARTLGHSKNRNATSADMSHATCYGACVHTPEWDSDLLRATLKDIMDRANLTQAAVGELAGRDRTMANRWLKGLHQPNFEAASRFTAAVRARRPDLGDLVDTFMRAAGYGGPPSTATPATSASGPAHETLEALRERAQKLNQSLGELLVDEGLADPYELHIPDALPPDEMIEEIDALDIPEEVKAKLIRLHLENRARRFEEERIKKKRPDRT